MRAERRRMLRARRRMPRLYRKLFSRPDIIILPRPQDNPKQSVPAVDAVRDG